MSSQHYFETPENIKISYKPAGLATRYVAFFLDTLLVGLLVFFVIIALLMLGIVSDRTMNRGFHKLDQDGFNDPDIFMMYFIGIATLIWGLGSFFYFGLSEYFFKGQTPGKKMCKIRVVKANGFSLDATSIFIRSIFRMIDQIPVLWIVPVLNKSSQRMGDMVAGTLVVAEETEQLSPVRTKISNVKTHDRKFRFDNAKLKILKPEDYTKIETFLERYHSLSIGEQDQYLNQILGFITKKMQVDMPVDYERVVFLQDLLASEYHRQNRLLG